MSGVQVPLKHLARLNPETLGEDTDPDHSFRYIDIAGTGRGFLLEEPEAMTFATSPSRARRVLRSGDTILSTVRTYLRAVWTLREADDDLVASTGFVCLRPRPSIDSRFLGWLAQANTVVDEVVGRSVGVSYPAINPSEVGRIKVSCPPMPAQRAIADYLDRETARTDALIEAKERMVALLLEEEKRLLLDAVGDWRSAGTSSLRQCGTTVVTGPFGTQLAAAEYVQDGVPVINPTHITHTGELSPDINVSVPETVAVRLARHRLRPGDIVLGRKGDVGRSAVVDRGNDGWVCGSDAIAVRTNPSRLNPKLLAMVLHVSLYRQQLEAASTGAMMANLNEGTLLGFRLPVTSLPVQERALARMVAVTTNQRRMSARLSSGVDLLQERRQAIVTAAVTGQLDIAEAE